jgi:hypothetical protein
MDALQRDSAALAARASVEKQPPRETLRALDALARAAAGLPAAPPPARRFPTEGAPKLSETWFC